MSSSGSVPSVKRRKVVSADVQTWNNLIRMKLECGHDASKISHQRKVPNTVRCRKCEAQQ